MSSEMDEAVQTFIDEARELLEAMETALLTMSGHAPDPEAVGAVFRAAHTIKGSAGLFGFDRIVAFTHVVESVLDRVRDGSLALDDDLVALLLGCADHSKSQIDAVDAGRLDTDEALQGRGRPLVAGLQQRLDGPDAFAAALPRGGATAAATAMPGPCDAATASADHWHI